MTKRTLLGIIVPSSNTVLEPATVAMVAPVPGVTAHFARVRVRHIDLSDASARQFDESAFMSAVEMLADARVDVVAWSGTAGGWLGVDHDEALCAAITDRTGVPATTAVLGLIEAFQAAKVTRYALVTPYVAAIQDRIVATLNGYGFECVAECHDDRTDNFSFSTLSPQRIAEMVRACAREEPQAIVILCTNVAGAILCDDLERETGIPVYDSVATTVWASMRAVGVDPSGVRGWGRFFQTIAAE